MGTARRRHRQYLMSVAIAIVGLTPVSSRAWTEEGRWLRNLAGEPQSIVLVGGEHYLKPSSPWESQRTFGEAVAASGNTVAVGAPGEAHSSGGACVR